MDKHNTITIDRSKYKTKQEFQSAVGELMTVLMDLEQVVVARYDDCGIYSFEFESDDPALGGDMPYWMSESERFVAEEYES